MYLRIENLKKIFEENRGIEKIDFSIEKQIRNIGLGKIK